MEIQLRGINRDNCVENDAPKISEEDETYARTKLGDKTTERNVLGFIWNSLEDHVIFEFRLVIQFAKELLLSKRSVLKLWQSFTTLLVFFLHMFTTIKVIFRKLWINCKFIFSCLILQ